MNKGNPQQKRNVVNLVELINKIKEGEIKVFVYDEAKGKWLPETTIKEIDVGRWGGKELTGRDITQDISKIGDIYTAISKMRFNHLGSYVVQAAAGQSVLTKPVSITDDSVVCVEVITDTQTKIKAVHTHKYVDRTKVGYEGALYANVRNYGAVTISGNKLLTLGNKERNVFELAIFDLNTLSRIRTLELIANADVSLYDVAGLVYLDGYIFALVTNLYNFKLNNAIVFKIDPETMEVVGQTRYPYGDVNYAVGMARVAKINYDTDTVEGNRLVVVLYDQSSRRSVYWALDTNLNSEGKFVGPAGSEPSVVREVMYQGQPYYVFFVGYANSGYVDVLGYGGGEEWPFEVFVVDTFRTGAEYINDIYAVIDNPDEFYPLVCAILNSDILYIDIFREPHFVEVDTGGRELYALVIDDYLDIVLVDEQCTIYKYDIDGNLLFSYTEIDQGLYYPLRVYYQNGYLYIPSEDYNTVHILTSPSIVSEANTFYLNAGANLYPNSLYTFTINASKGDTLNFIVENDCNLRLRLYTKG